MNKKQITIQKNALTQKIRDFFTNNNFTEVETPIMTPMPGMEPHLTPFETTLHTPTKNHPLYLNTSPELQMKKLLSQDFGNIFNITKVFRDTEINGSQHNPEFTMIEWYRENANYKDIMTDCENLITKIAPKDFHIDLTTPWPRMTTSELFKKHLNMDNIEDLDDDTYFELFLNKIEPNLPKDRPIFIYDYPVSQAALAKKSDKNPHFAERFELYIDRIELANAFSELIDAKEQRARLQEEQALRKKLNKTVFPIDEEFLLSLESIKTPCAGIALGLDRLLMLLPGLKSIEDLLLFPLNQMLKCQQQQTS